GEARPPDRAHHARRVRHVHRRVDRDPDKAHADHACNTRAREPFQPAACPIGTGFAEIDRWQLALWPWKFAKKDGWESATRDRHEALAKLTTRKAAAAVKQSVPPVYRLPPARAFSALFPTSRSSDNTQAGAVPLTRAEA